MAAASRSLKLLVPNAVTLGGLVLAWVAITRVFAGDALAGAWIGLLSMFTDRFDGVLARMLDAQSDFGVQLDSLSDLVAFGVTPAVVAYGFFHGRFGWSDTLLGAACALHVVCAAIRLARFNVRSAEGAHDGFIGFPTTMTAGFLFTFILSLGDVAPGLQPSWRAWFHLDVFTARALAPAVLIFGAVGMVCPLRVPKLGGSTRFAKIALALIVVGGMTCTVLRVLPEYGLFFTAVWFFYAFVHHAKTA